MVSLESITQFFVNNGTLRLSQRKTLAGLVWALLYEPLLGACPFIIGTYHIYGTDPTITIYTGQRMTRISIYGQAPRDCQDGPPLGHGQADYGQTLY